PIQIRVDQTAPANTLDTPTGIAAQTVISQPIAIGGTVVETGTIRTGIAASEVAFTPQSVARAPGDPALLIWLDDPLRAQTSRDDSVNSFNGAGAGGGCAGGGAPGGFGYAAQLDTAPSQSIGIWAMTVRPSTVSFGVWFNASCANWGLVSVMTPKNFTRFYDR